MSLYGTDKLLFSSLPFPSILREPSIRFLHIHTFLLRFIYLERTCSPRPRNHFSHRNYTWPANLSIIQSREDDCARKRELHLFDSTFFFFSFSFPLPPPSPGLAWWIIGGLGFPRNAIVWWIAPFAIIIFSNELEWVFFFFLTVWRKKETIKERSIAAWWFKLVGGVRNSSFETIMIMIIDCTKSGS